MAAQLDNTTEDVEPVLLHVGVLTHEDDTTLFINPGARRMYNAMRKSYYWPHMANDVYNNVKRDQLCR